MTPLRRHGRRPVAATVGLALALVLPAVALAHPLGNFTINHYAGIRVEADQVLLDVVIDQAEIPTFQARLAFDADGDGEVSDAEAEAGRLTECDALATSLELVVDGASPELVLTHAGLTFPPGVGGLSTMRLVCEFRAELAAPIAGPTDLSFADASFPERLGWREIVATGSGVTLSATEGVLRETGASDRLTAYPTDQLAQAPADRSLAAVVTPGGATLAPFVPSDATAVPGAVAPLPGSSAKPRPTPGATASPGLVAGGTGSAPGGVSGSELPSVFREADLTPLVLVISLLTAVALGAGHALTPGHGKTLMAAYLVGTRGTVWHAAGLGLSVTFSHTIGILVLAALVVGAQDVLAPDLVIRGAPFVAAISIVAIGGWMLLTEFRRRRTARSAAHAALDHDHGHELAHDEDHQHVAPATQPALGPTDAGVHSHGGVTHSHLPPVGSTITWRSLFVLGLAGGLIPSTSALLILLGSIAAGRAGFGFVLVVAFGLGMALVMGGIGIALVLARGRVDRMAPSSPLGRVSSAIPLAAAVLVFGLGLYLTAQAVGGSPVL